jgi:haloalkane dehalogenase
MLRKFDPERKKTARVLGAPMAYVEHGKGDPIVLLHGNPTSSYLWRKVIPGLARSGRCIAPDLIGMGASARIARGRDAYRFRTHAEYLEAFMEVMGLSDERVTLVGHDWGGPLIFDWGRRHSNAVKGVAYMETIVTPLTWDDWPEESRNIFQAMRSDAGEKVILEKNVFVERILPASVLEPLSEETLSVYQRPYLEPGESRRPTLTFPREIPIDGHPEHTRTIIEANEEWLSGPEVPKLFINAAPGFMLVGRPREVCRAWENQAEVTVPGVHFIQEDSGEEIGRHIRDWLSGL